MDIILVSHKSKTEMLSKIKQICETTSDDHNLIYTGLDSSASANRNYGLSRVTSDVFVMMDDDMDGFYDGWVEDLTKPMMEDDSIIIISARLMNKDGKYGHMMGNNRITSQGVHVASKSGYRGYIRVPTACMAIRKNPIRFDEGFIGSGYEDTAYLNNINEAYPDKKIMINNDCKLIHHNEEKNQGGEFFEHNKKHYLSIYPDDRSVINQKDWTGRKR